MNTVLVERYPTLGGVCLNVGCIPSKALLHVAAVMDEQDSFPSTVSVSGAQGRSRRVARMEEQGFGKLTSGLTGMARMRKVTVLQAPALSPDRTISRRKRKTGARSSHSAMRSSQPARSQRSSPSFRRIRG